MTMTQDEPFMTLSDSDSETISITTGSELESPARTSSVVVNSPLQPEDAVFPPSLNSSGLLPAYRFSDEIDEDYFCQRSTDNGLSPVVLGLGIVGLPAYGSGSTVNCSPTMEGQNKNTRSKRKGKNVKSDHSLWPELDHFPSPPGRRSVEWSSSSCISVEEMPLGSPESAWDFGDDEEALPASPEDAELFVEINITITAPDNTPLINSSTQDGISADSFVRKSQRGECEMDIQLGVGV